MVKGPNRRSPGIVRGYLAKVMGIINLKVVVHVVVVVHVGTRHGTGISGCIRTTAQYSFFVPTQLVTNNNDSFHSIPTTPTAAHARVKSRGGGATMLTGGIPSVVVVLFKNVNVCA